MVLPAVAAAARTGASAAARTGSRAVQGGRKYAAKKGRDIGKRVAQRAQEEANTRIGNKLRSITNADNAKISNQTAILMVSIALLVDILQAVLALFAVGLLLNRLIVPAAYGFFFLWFAIKGIPIISKKSAIRAIVVAITPFIEFIPVIGAISPTIAISVVAVVAFDRLESAGVPTGNIKKMASKVKSPRAGGGSRRQSRTVARSSNASIPQNVKRPRAASVRTNTPVASSIKRPRRTSQVAANDNHPATAQ